MNKKITLFCALFCLLTACNEATDNPSKNQNILNPKSTEGPESISSITLSPHLTELVFSAGGGDNLLGVSAYSNHPEQALDKQIIGDAFHLNLEIITELDPGVIFYWHQGTPIQTVEQLKSHGFNLVNIEIEQLADIPKAINQIATVLNTTPVTATTEFIQQLNLLKAKPRKQRSALIQISDQPIYTVNGSHWMSEAIGVCGLNNVFKDLEQLSTAVTLEAVLIKKPEVIVRLEALKADSQLAQWPSVPAIQNQHIAVLEADQFTRPTLRTLSAVKSLCEQVKNFQYQQTSNLDKSH